MEPRFHTIKVANLSGKGTHSLTFYDWGNVDAKDTVMCVHGLTRNAHDFDTLAPALAARGFRVLALNMPGRGTSAWLEDPMGYTYPAYMADCLAVMDNFHLRIVDWVGTSMGGIIGMMVEANSERIRKLVLNDIGTRLSAEALQRIYTYVTAMPKEFSDRAAADAYLRDAFKPFGITDPALWEKFVDHSLVTREGKLCYACDPRILEPLRELSKGFTEVQATDLTTLWERVKIPTLILHGAESDVLSIETIREMKDANPKVVSTSYAGVGHAPALMTPDQVSRVVDWLAGNFVNPVALGI